MLIHVNNSTAVLGTVVSIAIRDAGGSCVAIRDNGDVRPTLDPVVTAAYGHAHVLDVRDVESVIARLTRAETLGDVARLLSEDSLKRAGIILSVEFRPQWSDRWSGTLLVASEEV